MDEVPTLHSNIRDQRIPDLLRRHRHVLRHQDHSNGGWRRLLQRCDGRFFIDLYLQIVVLWIATRHLSIDQSLIRSDRSTIIWSMREKPLCSDILTPCMSIRKSWSLKIVPPLLGKAVSLLSGIDSINSLVRFVFLPMSFVGSSVYKIWVASTRNCRFVTLTMSSFVSSSQCHRRSYLYHYDKHERGTS
jgi:hypothetical protein